MNSSLELEEAPPPTGAERWNAGMEGPAPSSVSIALAIAQMIQQASVAKLMPFERSSLRDTSNNAGVRHDRVA
jgi:hypothetical protein